MIELPSHTARVVLHSATGGFPESQAGGSEGGEGGGEEGGGIVQYSFSVKNTLSFTETA